MVLEIANKLLLLRIDRDRRLAGRDRGLHRRIDVSELGITIGVIAPLSRLAVGLTTVVLLPQQVCHHALARFEALRGQCLDEVTQTAAHPAQR